MSVQLAEKIKSMSEAKCMEWAENPTINPITGRSIGLHKGIYTAIADRCKTLGIVLSGANESGTSNPLPKKVGDWTVPRTAEVWQASDVRKRATALSKAVAKFGFISDDHVKDAVAFNKIFRLLVDAKVIPADKRSAAESVIATLTTAMTPESKIRKYASAPRRTIDYHYTIMDITSRMLVGPATVPDWLHNDVVVAQFNNYVRNGGGTLTQEDAEMDETLIALTALENEVVLERANPTGSARARVHNAHVIPASRERSLPDSLSQRRVKQVKPKRRPEDPDEYYPWSVTEEAVQTERSRFRSHAKLSAVSPGPQPSPGAAPLAPLDPKKRTAILAELRDACTAMKDMISMQRFDRMNKKALQLVVRLGAAGQQRCYYVRNLYQLWVAAAKTGAPLTDPLTREHVTDEEKADIMGKVRHLRPNAADLRNKKLLHDPKIELVIQPKQVPTHFGNIGMYELKTWRQVGPHMYLVHDLGMVPSDIELADVNGDMNLTSAAVIGSIRTLFDSGRLLTQNFVPYQCCTIHLRKSLNYWTTRTNRATNGSPVRNNINMRLWNQLASEIYAAL